MCSNLGMILYAPDVPLSQNTDIRGSIKQWNATGYTVWKELPAEWKKLESNLQADYF
jgi:hypothetical protein